MIINLRMLPLGKAIQLKRIMQDIEQRALANTLDMNVAILCRVEKGKQELPRKYVDVVMEFLEN